MARKTTDQLLDELATNFHKMLRENKVENTEAFELLRCLTVGALATVASDNPLKLALLATKFRKEFDNAIVAAILRAGAKEEGLVPPRHEPEVEAKLKEKPNGS